MRQQRTLCGAAGDTAEARGSGTPVVEGRYPRRAGSGSLGRTADDTAVEKKDHRSREPLEGHATSRDSLGEDHGDHGIM
ncbi:hypothetical protein [Phaffia rhodozyma]|uniref:Uncharacterized protein n=1 Tax=Phaffia rhodozyma TaxID=264483 RepID=A0A0F7SN31_PHARH|nr:hypothetical protein [Phaffia rhodozyma]